MGAMTFNEKLEEIWRLLEEAYDHYFTYESHCKSQDGVVSIHYPNYFEMKKGNCEPSISIYSYCLGPSREHYFKDIDEALKTVREWHKNEMEYVPDMDEDGEMQ